MKNTILPLQIIGITVFLFLYNNLYGQGVIPNGDFESWPPGNNNNPEFWDSPNSLTGGFPIFLFTVEKTTDSHTGNYAASLTTSTFFGETIPGLLSLGTLNIDLINPEDTEFIGVPFSDRPAQLGGYYKYSSPGDDFGGIGILLSRYNEVTAQRDSIAFGLTVLFEEAEYTAFSFPLQYFSYQEPDSLNIVILSSASPFIVSGSNLIIDDLFFDYEGTPVVDIGGDVSICPGESHTFDAGYEQGYTYTWINQETGEVLSNDNTLTVNEAGIFQAIVQNQQGLPGFDSAEVFMLDAPQVFGLTVEGTFCEDDPLVDFILDGSETGVQYTLWHDGVQISEAINGTGDVLVFAGYDLPGQYVVLAEDGGVPCSSETGALNVAFVPRPQVFEVTGGGTYSPGEEGVEVGLSGSETTAVYFLYRNAEELVTQKTGTGQPLSFGPQPEGLYTVEAVNASWYCSEGMEGEVLVDMETSLTEVITGSFKIYPNPVADRFRIQSLHRDISGKLRLVDSSGSVHLQDTFSIHRNGIWKSPDLSHLPAGIYILQLFFEQGGNHAEVLFLNR